MHIDESKRFDRRTVEKNLKEGIISPKEWQDYLKALPDASDNVDFVLSEEAQEHETREEQARKTDGSTEEEAPPEKAQ